MACQAKRGGPVTLRAATPRRRHRLCRALVIAECSLTLTLPAAAGTAIQTFWARSHLNLGIRTDHVLTFELQAANHLLPKPEQVASFYNELTGKDSWAAGREERLGTDTVSTMWIGPAFPFGPFRIAGVYRDVRNAATGTLFVRFIPGCRWRTSRRWIRLSRELDGSTLVLVGTVLLAAAALGCGLAARRAAHIEPLVALRNE